ncbi:MAG: hypothetical protein IJB25_00710 [Clostridia bacterium]|nr:hypothetical protein [Clostridia bacterium]
MFKKVLTFLSANWIDVALILVGLSALLIYWIQERRKVSEAASLIVMQVEDLQKRLREIATYIVEGQLNAGAFYESQVLLKTDYWDKYKHYFIRKMDGFSFNTFDAFYSCAEEVLEQQQLMKNLQKNSFFLTQQAIMNAEMNSIMQNLSLCIQNPVNPEQLIQAMMGSIPQSMDIAQKTAVENTLKGLAIANPNVAFKQFWNMYNTNKGNLHTVINQKGLTEYIPTQIRISLENALRKYNSIQIIGCNGYRKLKKLASRKL